VREVVKHASGADVLDAVGRAAREASDVLLLCYRGAGPAPSAGLDLAVVAELMSRSPAVRPVVILDEDRGAARSCFARADLPWYDIRHPISLTVLAAEPGSAGAFTSVLVRALTAGIRGGPGVPELADLRAAMEADFREAVLSSATESYEPPMGRVGLRRGYKTPKLALGVNPSAVAPYRHLALPANAEMVDDEYWQ
jgi:hypothetical protein